MGLRAIKFDGGAYALARSAAAVARTGNDTTSPKLFGPAPAGRTRSKISWRATLAIAALTGSYGPDPIEPLRGLGSYSAVASSPTGHPGKVSSVLVGFPVNGYLEEPRTYGLTLGYKI